MNRCGNLEKRLKMMITEKTWKVPVAVWLGIVAMASCILPQGRVYAQDFEAVERRLGGAVEAGELTLEQASIMMKALKRSAGSKRAHNREMEAKKRRYMAFAKEIEAAVEAGKISKEDAEEKLIAVRKKMFRDAGRKQEDRSDKHGISVEEYRRAEAKIRELVKKGEVSKEDAEKRLIEMRKSIRTEKSEGNDKRS